MQRDDLALFERTLRHATESNSGAQLDTALADLGWDDALASDERAAISVLFELQGATNTTSSALSRVVANGLGVAIDSTTSVVLPGIGRFDPPGALAGDRITIDGVAIGAVEGRDVMAVVAEAHDAHVGLVVPADSLALSPAVGIDPSFGLVAVTGEVPATDAQVTDVTTPVHWTDAVALAQLAVGHELLGASRRMLELARVHALERIQFGRPIAAFQAVRHRLADTLVAIETAAAALDAAWLARSPQSAALAKAVAARSARTAARNCQQVLAGIGFTTEHDLHRYVRRVLVAEQLFGGSRLLTRELGEDVIATRRLPALLPL